MTIQNTRMERNKNQVDSRRCYAVLFGVRISTCPRIEL